MGTCKMRVVTILAILLVANGKIFPLETLEHQMERMALNDEINGNHITKVDTDQYKTDLIHDFWLMKRNNNYKAECLKEMQDRILFETIIADFMSNVGKERNNAKPIKKSISKSFKKKRSWYPSAPLGINFMKLKKRSQARGADNWNSKRYLLNGRMFQ